MKKMMIMICIMTCSILHGSELMLSPKVIYSLPQLVRMCDLAGIGKITAVDGRTAIYDGRVVPVDGWDVSIELMSVWYGESLSNVTVRMGSELPSSPPATNSICVVIAATNQWDIYSANICGWDYMANPELWEGDPEEIYTGYRLESGMNSLFPTNGNAEAVLFTSNLVNVAKIGPDKTAFYHLLRDGVTNSSERVRMDSYNFAS